jgi:hypothetical protein
VPVNASSRRDGERLKHRSRRQQCLNRFDDPQMQGSLRPSRSSSSFSPCTILVPRFTLVSLGYPLRRLLVVVKGEVFVLDLHHGLLLRLRLSSHALGDAR